MEVSDDEGKTATFSTKRIVLVSIFEYDSGCMPVTVGATKTPPKQWVVMVYVSITEEYAISEQLFFKTRGSAHKVYNKIKGFVK